MDYNRSMKSKPTNIAYGDKLGICARPAEGLLEKDRKHGSTNTEMDGYSSKYEA